MARVQRVEKLVKSFMEYHYKGYSIPKIAEIMQVNISTIYKNLQEIANFNGVSREKLLEQPHSTHSSNTFSHREKINLDELESNFSKLDDGINTIIKYLDELLERM